MESLPPELSAVADEVTVILPWGSLLAAVLCPLATVLARVRALCRPGASLTVVCAVDASRDAAELLRLGVPPLDASHVTSSLPAGYAAAGFERIRSRWISRDELQDWGTTWSARLAHGSRRAVLRLDARAG